VTGADGTVLVAAAGEEGESVTLHADCPKGYDVPILVPVTLRRVSGEKPPEVEVHCTRTSYQLTLQVHAPEGPHLPVTIFDKVVGETDSNGSFSHTLPMHPGDGLEVTLVTAGFPRIHPINPVFVVMMPPHDKLETLDMKFTWDPLFPRTIVR
jgi:hypothetical protein